MVLRRPPPDRIRAFGSVSGSDFKNCLVYQNNFFMTGVWTAGFTEKIRLQHPLSRGQVCAIRIRTPLRTMVHLHFQRVFCTEKSQKKKNRWNTAARNPPRKWRGKKRLYYRANCVMGV